MTCTRMRLATAMGLLTIITLAACAGPATTVPPGPTQTSSVTSTPANPSPTPSVQTPAGPYGELRIGLSTFSAENWDPVGVASADSPRMIPLFGWMFWLTNRELTPGIIEKWEMAPDGLSWTYHIRKGVKFHNGDELTAKDVKFTFDRYISPESYQGDVRTMVDHTDVIDDYTVQIYTKGVQVYLPNMNSNTTPHQAYVQPKDYTEKNGMPYFKLHPVGAGPFKRTNYIPGDVIEYEAFQTNYTVMPAFKKLTLILVPEQTTRIAMVKTAAIDIGEGIDLEYAVALEKAGYTTYQVFESAPRIQFHGTYDPRAASLPTSDIRIRQALTLAVDKQEIGKTLFYGRNGPLEVQSLYYGTPDIDSEYWAKYLDQAYRYDPEEAKRLLKEAGYPEKFANPNIKIYTFVMAGASYLPKLAEVVQGYWSKVGISAQVVGIDQGTYNSWRKEPNISLLGNASTISILNLAPAPRLLGDTYRNTGNQRLTEGGGGKNAIPELDTYINDAFSQMDPAKRADDLAKAVKLAVDSYTAFTFGGVPNMVAAGPAVRFDPQDLQNLETAYVPIYAHLAKHAK